MIAKSFEIHLALVNKVLKQMFKEKKNTKFYPSKPFLAYQKLNFFPFYQELILPGTITD